MVAMSELAIPNASALQTPRQIAALAAQVVLWADTATDVGAVRDAAAKWAAITEYVRRTSREGVAEAEAALRRLEIRIAELSPNEQGKRTDLALPHRDDEVRLDPSTYRPGTGAAEARTAYLASQALAQFRKMARHRDVVEDVIATSTDSDPPSRAKVLREIDRRELVGELAEDVRANRDDLERAGYTARQAADDKRRADVFAAVRLLADAVDRLTAFTPEQVEWAITSTPPVMKHVADLCRERIASITRIAPYQRGEQ